MTGAQLKAVMNRNGWTVRALAGSLGVSESIVWKWRRMASATVPKRAAERASVPPDRTVAAQLALRFHNDGEQFTNNRGEDLLDVAGVIAEEVIRRYDAMKFVFVDDSVITIHGNGWDLGFKECWCWQGAPSSTCRIHGPRRRTL